MQLVPKINMWCQSPMNQEHEVSLFILVIIVEKLVILGQFVICWNPTGLGLSMMLWGKVKLKILPHLNMSLLIGDIQKIRAMLFVRMLIIILHRMSKKFKQKKPSYLSSLRHHRSHPIQMSKTPGLEVEGSEGVANKSYIRHSTSYGTSGSTASASVCSCLLEWQIEEEQIKALQEKATEAH
jgi:hypothetical protein